MNTTKKELFDLVEEIERKIEANQDLMIEYQNRIAQLDETNANLTRKVSTIMKKAREME